MFAYLLCLNFILSNSMAAPKLGACEDAVTEPLCAQPCVWFVDEGEGECLEASELPKGAATGSFGITLKVCSRITEQPDCYGYAVDEAEYEAGEPMVVTKVGEETAVCTWNPNAGRCSSALLQEGEGGAGAIAMGPAAGAERPEPEIAEGMGPMGGEGAERPEPEIAEGMGPTGGEAPEPEIGEGMGMRPGMVSESGGLAAGSGQPVANEEAIAIVEQVIDQAAEMYSEMKANVPAEGVAEVPESAAEAEPMKAETYCPTLLTPDKCVAPCIWTVTQCMELDIMKSNPLPEEKSNPLPEEKNNPLPEEKSNPLPDESSKVPLWKLATLTSIGLICGVIFGVVFAQCSRKETNNDVFVPLDRQV